MIYFRRSLLIGVVFLLLPAIASAQTKPPGKQFALLVGVNAYRHDSLPSLQFAENDVEALATLLRAPSAAFTTVRVLSGTRGMNNAKELPTATNIRAALAELLENKGKLDTVLIALSGHGVQLEVEDPEGKKPTKSFAYFCPSDADLLGVRFANGQSKTLLLMSDLFRQLARCGAGTRLVFVDACRNELSVTGAKRGIAIDKLSIPEGVGALFSCGTGQHAWETKKLGKGHGVFFHYVLQGLRGEARNEDGEVTWDRLSEFVKRQVTRQVPVLIGGGARQTPHEFKNSVGESPILARFLKGLDPRKDSPPVRKPNKGPDLEGEYRTGRNLLAGQGVKIDFVTSARHIQKAADKGHVLAQATLAYANLYGYGVERNPLRASRLAEQALPGLRRAADEGNVEAIGFLAWFHSEGMAVKQDKVRARELYRKTVDRDSLQGMNALGWLLENGQGGKKDPNGAEELYRRAADRGLALAQVNVGRLNERAGKFEDARIWYRKAAEQNHPSAQCNLGHLIASGKGGETNRQEAKSWYHKAAKQGQGMAMNNLGWLAELEKNKAEARRWYLKAAEAKVPLAKFNLGRLAEREKNLDEAIRYYREAAEGNLPRAASRLGLYFKNGEGGEKDFNQAIRWYRQAADSGEALAQSQLGWIYFQQKKYADALPWLVKAAAQKNASAQNRLGLLYEHGWAVPPNRKKAADLYHKAAEQKHGPAQFNLGRLLLHGPSGHRDVPTGLAWLRLAAAQNNPKAQELLRKFQR